VRIGRVFLNCDYLASPSGQQDVVLLSGRVHGTDLSDAYAVTLRARAGGRDDAGTARVALARGTSEAPVTVRAPVTAGTAPYTARITLVLTPVGLLDDTADDNTLVVSAAIPFPRPVEQVRTNCGFA
jgi:hypothetical protein